MQGDFSRDPILEVTRFTRVLAQQGRVQLDSDANEQISIFWYYLRALASDLIGPWGGPASMTGYAVSTDGKGDFALSPGHYYVAGLLCENKPENYTKGEQGPLYYSQQNDLPGVTPINAPENGYKNYLVYLDVFERHVNSLQDPSIREVALNGPDTTSRARLITQVKVTDSLPDGALPNDPGGGTTWRDWLLTPSVANQPSRWQMFVESLQSSHRGMLKARGKPPSSTDTTICLASPDGNYRGFENQLYRVEIHRAGNSWDKTTGIEGLKNAATFKWSRENGCVVFAIQDVVFGTDNTTATAIIERARDDRLGLSVGEWVELVSDLSELQGSSGPLMQVTAITPLEDPTCQQVSLQLAQKTQLSRPPQSAHPLLRRWDSRPDIAGLNLQQQAATDGALPIQEGTELSLEDGISIFFDAVPTGAKQSYRLGDYWLIPARTAIEDVIWPGGSAQPISEPPMGVIHYYAPLAILPVGSGGTLHSLQTVFKSLGELTTTQP